MTVEINDIKAFWDDRARTFGAKPRATLNEAPLRELEIAAMARRIARLRPRFVLDVGCGNGYSTRSFAHRFPDIQFTGIDYSAEMIRQASLDVPANCTFAAGDVLDLDSLPEGPFDLILTQRCIQNLPADDLQTRAIENLLARRSARGVLMLMECSRNGVRSLNTMRARFGRDPIADLEPWHNRFMRDGRLRRRFGAHVEHFSSTYMFLVKVLHPRLARIATRLPALGTFGYDKLYVIA